MTLPTVVLLIRHGETAWNAGGRWQGQRDIGLSPAGLRQAELLAARLLREGAGLDALFTSDLSRAAQTAAVLGAALGVTPVPDRALREIDVGTWEGLTHAEAAVRDPEVYARVEAGEDLPRGGAERLADLRARVAAAFDRLIPPLAGKRIALVAHGGTVRAALFHALRGNPEVASVSLRVGNASLSVLASTPAGWSLRLLDDTSHLGGERQAPDMMGSGPA